MANQEFTREEFRVRLDAVKRILTTDSFRTLSRNKLVQLRKDSQDNFDTLTFLNLGLLQVDYIVENLQLYDETKAIAQRIKQLVNRSDNLADALTDPTTREQIIGLLSQVNLAPLSTATWSPEDRERLLRLKEAADQITEQEVRIRNVHWREVWHESLRKYAQNRIKQELAKSYSEQDAATIFAEHQYPLEKSAILIVDLLEKNPQWVNEPPFVVEEVLRHISEEIAVHHKTVASHANKIITTQARNRSRTLIEEHAEAQKKLEKLIPFEAQVKREQLQIQKSKGQRQAQSIIAVLLAASAEIGKEVVNKDRVVTSQTERSLAIEQAVRETVTIIPTFTGIITVEPDEQKAKSTEQPTREAAKRIPTSEAENVLELTKAEIRTLSKNDLISSKLLEVHQQALIHELQTIMQSGGKEAKRAEELLGLVEKIQPNSPEAVEQILAVEIEPSETQVAPEVARGEIVRHITPTSKIQEVLRGKQRELETLHRDQGRISSTQFTAHQNALIKELEAIIALKGADVEEAQNVLKKIQLLQPNRPEEIEQILASEIKPAETTARQVVATQAEFNKALQRFKSLADAQNGQISLGQFNLIKNDLISTLQNISKQGGDDGLKARMFLDQVKAWKFDTVFQLVTKPSATAEEIRHLRANVLNKGELVSVTAKNESQLNALLVHQALTTLIVKHQDKEINTYQFRMRALILLNHNEVAYNLLFLYKNIPDRFRGYFLYHLQVLERRQTEFHKWIKEQIPPGRKIGEFISRTPTRPRRQVGGPLGDIANYFIATALGLPPYLTQSGQTRANTVQRPSPLSRILPRPSLSIGRLATTSVTKSLWFWVIIITVLIIFLLFIDIFHVFGSRNSAFVPSGLGSSRSNEGGANTFADGSCPLKGPTFVIRNTYQRDSVRGHGSPDYWSYMTGCKNEPPVRSCQDYPAPCCTSDPTPPTRYSIPDGGMYAGCYYPNQCPGIYGLALDVRTEPRGVAPVYIPDRLCVAGKGCSTETLNWTVSAVESRTALYLTADPDSQGRVWKILFIHVDWNHKGSYQSGESVGMLTNLTNNQHVHFEITLDGVPADPFPFCDGVDDEIGGEIPVGEYCAIDNQVTDTVTGNTTSIGQVFWQTLPPPVNKPASEVFQCICSHESSSRPTVINDSCLSDDDPSKTSPLNSDDYSIGLFQINLLYRDNPTFSSFLNTEEGASLKQALIEAGKCPGGNCQPCAAAFSPYPRPEGTTTCEIRDQILRDVCVTWFSDPYNNIKFAGNMFGGTNLNPWEADANPDKCNFQALITN
ncbi:hypothetical protein C4579_04285 [Candidatus Microgenomates bacterium]|nr:MAG: hypothetical protein C4579_04285 [Candidatus Microgenomates bacterium]